MGHGQMLRVSRVEGWLARQRAAGLAPGPGAPGDCLIYRAGGSGPSSGERALRLHLVILAPGTRGEPHVHDAADTTVYLVSGQAELWHGAGLDKRSTAHAGDTMTVPAGAPHLVVNRGDVAAIAVIARSDPPDRGGTVVIELPRHLVGLAGIPVGSDR